MSQPTPASSAAYFVGRVEEQKQFRAALHEMLKPPPKENLPYISLLYGDGGMGKTMLARRFVDIATTEAPFVDQFQVLWVDWADEAKKQPGLQAGRDRIDADDIFKTLHAVAVRARWGRQFRKYTDALSQQAEAEKQVSEMLLKAASENSLDELDALRSASVSALARIVRTRLPMLGDAGEQLVQSFLDAGIKVGLEQAARLRFTLETWLRAHLKPDYFDHFLNPHEQLAQALARGIENVASKKRLIMVLDSYESVDRADIWVRAVMRASGPRVFWIVAGRNNLLQSRKFGSDYLKGYEDDFPRRLLTYSMRRLGTDDIAAYFKARVAERKLPPDLLQLVSQATHGIPLAVHEAADIWRTGADLKALIGDVAEITSASQIVQKLTDSYLRYVVKEDDKRILFALTLAQGDVDVLRALLQEESGPALDLDALLRRLERDYASVHADRARLHDAPAIFLREHLRSDIMRTSLPVRTLLQRAITFLQKRLPGLEKGLPLLEDRCQDMDWARLTLQLIYYVFWDDRARGWRMIIPRLLEAWLYNRELAGDLLRMIGEWDERLGVNERRLLQTLQAVVDDSADSPHEQLLATFSRLEERGWLAGDGEQERHAILQLRWSGYLAQHGQSADALARLQGLESAIPPGSRILREAVADAMEALGQQMVWPDGQPEPGFSAATEKLMHMAAAIAPQRQTLWLQRATNLERGRQYEPAIEAYRTVLKLNPHQAMAHIGLGNAYAALNQFQTAVEAYQQAARLNPADPRPHVGLGRVFEQQGEHQQAAAAYERAVQLNRAYAPAYTGLGQVYASQDALPQSLVTYQQALQADPRYAPAYCGQADVLLRQGDYGAAIDAYQQALACDPTCAPALSGLGDAYLRLHLYDEALTHYRRSALLDDRHAPAYLGLG